MDEKLKVEDVLQGVTTFARSSKKSLKKRGNKKLKGKILRRKNVKLRSLDNKSLKAFRKLQMKKLAKRGRR